MKTNYTDMAKRYRLAEEIVWGKLARWKKIAIEEDRKANPNSRHINEFTKAIVDLAESKEDLTLQTVDYKTDSTKTVVTNAS